MRGYHPGLERLETVGRGERRATASSPSDDGSHHGYPRRQVHGVAYGKVLTRGEPSRGTVEADVPRGARPSSAGTRAKAGSPSARLKASRLAERNNRTTPDRDPRREEKERRRSSLHKKEDPSRPTTVRSASLGVAPREPPRNQWTRPRRTTGQQPYLNPGSCDDPFFFRKRHEVTLSRIPGTLDEEETSETAELHRKVAQLTSELQAAKEELQSTKAELERSVRSAHSSQSQALTAEMVTSLASSTSTSGQPLLSKLQRDFTLPDPSCTDIKKHTVLGGNNTVYRCSMGGVTFVMKKIHVTDERAVSETSILQQLDHPNIVKYLGYELVSPTQMHIFMEYTPYSLHTYMKRLTGEGRQFRDRELSRIALEVCKGLHYLHCKAPVQIIHRDLKSKNILLDVDADNEIREVKLCDFGVSKVITPETVPVTMVGTYYWMPPEVLSDDHHMYTCKADIWSYGMVLVELTTLHAPYYENGNNWLTTKNMILHGRPPHVNPNAPKKIKHVIFWCLNMDPEQRPTTEDIMLQLVSSE